MHHHMAAHTYSHPGISSLSLPFTVFFPKLPTPFSFLALNRGLLKSNLKRTANLPTIKLIVYPASLPIYSAFLLLQWVISSCTWKARPYHCYLHPCTCSLFAPSIVIPLFCITDFSFFYWIVLYHVPFLNTHPSPPTSLRLLIQRVGYAFLPLSIPVYSYPHHCIEITHVNLTCRLLYCPSPMDSSQFSLYTTSQYHWTFL